MSEDGGCQEEMEEMSEEDEEVTLEAVTPEKRARHAITGRGVTLQMLMADGIIEPGEGLLTLEYLVSKCNQLLITQSQTSTRSQLYVYKIKM